MGIMATKSGVGHSMKLLAPEFLSRAEAVLADPTNSPMQMAAERRVKALV